MYLSHPSLDAAGNKPVATNILQILYMRKFVRMYDVCMHVTLSRTKTTGPILFIYLYLLYFTPQLQFKHLTHLKKFTDCEVYFNN